MNIILNRIELRDNFFSEFGSRILNFKMGSNPLNQQYSILKGGVTQKCNVKISSINIKIKTGNSDCNKTQYIQNVIIMRNCCY